MSELRSSQVLTALAKRYESSRAGRKSAAARDFQIAFNKLLEAAGATTGEAYQLAVKDLMAAENAGALQLERHRRDPKIIDRIRLPLEWEDRLYELLGKDAPADARRKLASLFKSAAGLAAGTTHHDAWRNYCLEMMHAAQCGGTIAPFDRTDVLLTRELLAVAPRLLRWDRESYTRFASCVLCGNSKRLGQLTPRLERILDTATNGEVHSLAQLGISDTGGGCWLHGPARLILPEGDLDLSLLAAPAHFSSADLEGARLQSEAAKCLIVENGTMLIELARLSSGVLLMSSGFRGGMANRAATRLVSQLPSSMEIWHFGDADPAGFAILANLRKRTGRTISSIHMRHRPSPDDPILLTAAERNQIMRLIDDSALTEEEKQNLRNMLERDDKGRFEQESLGLPEPAWPFYREQ